MIFLLCLSHPTPVTTCITMDLRADKLFHNKEGASIVGIIAFFLAVVLLMMIIIVTVFLKEYNIHTVIYHHNIDFRFIRSVFSHYYYLLLPLAESSI